MCRKRLNDWGGADFDFWRHLNFRRCSADSLWCLFSGGTLCSCKDPMLGAPPDNFCGCGCRWCFSDSKLGATWPGAGDAAQPFVCDPADRGAAYNI